MPRPASPDLLEQLFFVGPGRLRGGFRLALFLGAWLVATGPVRGIAGLILPGAVLPWVAGWFGPAAVAGATWLLLRKVDERPWSDVSLGPEAWRPRAWLAGGVTGTVAIALPVGVLVATGLLDRVPGTDGALVGAMLYTAWSLLPAALSEELLARGYPFAVLRQGLGWPAATAITSVAFGLLHLANPGVTPQAIALVIAAGVWLAVVRLVTGSLVAAWMAHFAWNWWLAGGFHAPVSGLPFPTPGWRLVDAGPDWLTGGTWGPEAGFLSALGMIAGLGVLARGPFARRDLAGAPRSTNHGGPAGRTEHGT